MTTGTQTRAELIAEIEAERAAKKAAMKTKLMNSREFISYEMDLRDKGEVVKQLEDSMDAVRLIELPGKDGSTYKLTCYPLGENLAPKPVALILGLAQATRGLRTPESKIAFTLNTGGDVELVGLREVFSPSYFANGEITPETYAGYAVVQTALNAAAIAMRIDLEYVSVPEEALEAILQKARVSAERRKLEMDTAMALGSYTMA